MTPEEVLAIIAKGMTTDPDMSSYIALAKLSTSQACFGENYPLAVALRAAHMWELNTKRGGQSGVITYKAEGRLMASYGGVGVIRDALELTNYGMQLKKLIRETCSAVSTSAQNIYDGCLAAL